jgi:hypothetical protein
MEQPGEMERLDPELAALANVQRPVDDVYTNDQYNESCDQMGYGTVSVAGGMNDPPKDPPVSEAQRRAMFAAKAGHSTLGIPQKVGAEFADADKGGHLPARKGKK